MEETRLMEDRHNHREVLQTVGEDRQSHPVEEDTPLEAEGSRRAVVDLVEDSRSLGLEEDILRMEADPEAGRMTSAVY